MSRQLRSTKFSTDPVAHHPIRLAVMVHLARVGGRDRLSAIHRVIAPVSSQAAFPHVRHLERAGYISREIRFVARGLPRAWLELTPAGYSALARYRDAILNMIDGAIAEPAAVNLNSMEINPS